MFTYLKIVFSLIGFLGDLDQLGVLSFIKRTFEALMPFFNLS